MVLCRLPKTSLTAGVVANTLKKGSTQRSFVQGRTTIGAMLIQRNPLLLTERSLLVHEANIQDARGGKLLLVPLKDGFPRLQLIWADSGYKKEGFCEWVKAELGWEVEIVDYPWSGLRGVRIPEGVEVD